MVTMLPLRGVADIIILKDGTRVEAQNIREENGLVRFSIPNYDGIVITYSSEIVERIVSENAKYDRRLKSTEDKEAVDSHGDTEVSSANGKILGASPVSDEQKKQGETSSIGSFRETGIDKSLVESVAGIQFYSARRSFKYQTGPNDRFHTFKEAVDDLAIKFNKDSYWIGQNLGNTNDLEKIYVNLNRPVDQVDSDTETTSETSGILFYDPRRVYKYWVGTDSKHHTLDEAIETLANQYNRSSEWVIDHLGETNDLSEIHRNLEAGLQSESRP